MDLISAHQYFEDFGDLQEHLSSGHRMEAFIKDIVAHIDHVKSVKKSAKQVNISFDEWNVWHMSRDESKAPTGKDWPVAPVLLEDRYTVADAVVVGDLLITLLRNTDRVHSASLAQLVNVIAPIMTEPGGRAWKQTTFHPFALTSQHAKGTVLQLAVESPLLSGGKTAGLRGAVRRRHFRRGRRRGGGVCREPFGHGRPHAGRRRRRSGERQGC